MGGMAERVLVNYFYAHPVGHAIEALHYAAGHHAADPDREVHVALSSRTPVELAGCCPFVTAAYAIDHPFLEPGPAPFPTVVPTDWHWVLDDARRYQRPQLERFPGMRDWYAATDRQLVARHRATVGSPQAGYVPHTPLRLNLPEPARARARALLPGGTAVAVLPAGSGEAALYPSAAAWSLILDALTTTHPEVQLVAVGKLASDGRTSTSGNAVDAVRRHPSSPVDAVDLPLLDQLALIEQCALFLSPHSGLGMASLAVGTPWLTIGGGRWFEYFFNHVPFRSVIPDTTRFPAYSTVGDLPLVTDDDGPRTPSMSDTRIRADLDRILVAAGELLTNRVGYDQALTDYYRDLAVAVPDANALWSIDGVHRAYR